MNEQKKNAARIKGLIKKSGEYNRTLDLTVDILAGMVTDYERVKAQWEELGAPIVGEYTNKAGATNLAKHPQYQALEALRTQILSYLKEAGLTISSLKKQEERAPEGSKLFEALARLGDEA